MKGEKRKGDKSEQYKKETRRLKVKTHIGADTLPMAMLYTQSYKRTYSFWCTHTWRLSTNNTESKKGEGLINKKAIADNDSATRNFKTLVGLE